MLKTIPARPRPDPAPGSRISACGAGSVGLSDALAQAIVEFCSAGHTGNLSLNVVDGNPKSLKIERFVRPVDKL